MQIMTCKQWHSNDRKGKMNTRTCVKIKKLSIRKIYYYYYNYYILLKCI